jgi:hypothetical protein
MLSELAGDRCIRNVATPVSDDKSRVTKSFLEVLNALDVLERKRLDWFREHIEEP